MILKERPTLIGPNLSRSHPICIQCYRLVSQNDFVPCRKCSLPFCSWTCAESTNHEEECAIFCKNPAVFYENASKTYTGCHFLNRKNAFYLERSKEKPQLSLANYQLILPVRVLLLKRQNVRAYKKFMSLQSHIESRIGSADQDRVDQTIVKPLNKLKLHEEASRDWLQEVCGIFDTNSFDLSCFDGQADITGVYTEAAMLMHSCVKNARIMFRFVWTNLNKSENFQSVR